METGVPALVGRTEQEKYGAMSKMTILIFSLYGPLNTDYRPFRTIQLYLPKIHKAFIIHKAEIHAARHYEL